MRYMALAALHRAGFDLSRSQPNMIDFLRSRDIGCVLDVGANTGQFGRWLRNHGYTGRMISFEPIASVYQRLVQRAARDDQWVTHNLAIGDKSGSATINVSRTSEFSSFLPVSPAATCYGDHPAPERTEIVTVATLDQLDLNFSGNLFLKVDTQGFEREVLRGAAVLMRQLAGIQLELPIVHLYQGAWTLHQAIEYMREHGFIVSQVSPVNFSPRDNVSMVEIDVIFRRFDPAIDG